MHVTVVRVRFGLLALLALMALLVALTGVFAAPVGAQTAVTVATSDYVIDEANGTVTIVISINPANNPVNAVQLLVDYDPSLIQPVLTGPDADIEGAPDCQGVDGALAVCGPLNPDGQVAMSTFRFTGAWNGSAPIELIQLDFVAQGTTGVSDLTLTIDEIFQPGNSRLPGSAQSGSVRVGSPAPDPTPTPTAAPTATPQPSATPTPVPSATPVPEPSATPSPSPTATATPAPTATARPGAIPAAPTSEPATPTPTSTPDPDATPVPSPTVEATGDDDGDTTEDEASDPIPEPETGDTTDDPEAATTAEPTAEADPDASPQPDAGASDPDEAQQDEASQPADELTPTPTPLPEASVATGEPTTGDNAADPAPHDTAANTTPAAPPPVDGTSVGLGVAALVAMLFAGAAFLAAARSERRSAADY